MGLEDYPVPSTLEEAVLTLQLMLSKDPDSGISRWAEMSVTRALAESHHAIGQDIRNQWLWHESKPLRAWFIEKHGIWHADDMSSITLACLHHRLNRLPYDLDADVRRFKDYWEKHKIVTQPKTAAPSRYDLLKKNDG